MIKFENFTKKYGTFTALDNICLELKTSGVISVLGANGAGKSTLLKAVCARHFSSSGCVYVQNLETEENYEKIKEITGFVEEIPNLPGEFYVDEYISFLDGIYGKKKKNEVLEQCSLLDVAKMKISSLSKGYAQRVNLAKALIHEPEILVLDEAFSGLDLEQSKKFRNLIKEYGKSHCVIFSTHIFREADELSDWVVFMDRGKVIKSCSKLQFLETGSCLNLEQACFNLLSSINGK